MILPRGYRRSLDALAWVIVGLCAVNLIDQILGQPYWPITRLFYMGMESNLPTWYTSMLWAAAAGFAWRCRHPSTDWRNWWTWVAFATLFALFSLDEVAELHEQVGEFLSRRFLGDATAHLRANRWWVFIVPMLLVVLVVMSRFAHPVLAKRPRARRYIYGGIFTLLVGAVGVEASVNIFDPDGSRVMWRVAVVIEETLEMAGAWLVLVGCITAFAPSGSQLHQTPGATAAADSETAAVDGPA